ncbi:hypothetical protein Ancab_038731 [Ancistrocladus abbreviatus]
MSTKLHNHGISEKQVCCPNSKSLIYANAIREPTPVGKEIPGHLRRGRALGHFQETPFDVKSVEVDYSWLQNCYVDEVHLVCLLSVLEKKMKDSGGELVLIFAPRNERLSSDLSQLRKWFNMIRPRGADVGDVLVLLLSFSQLSLLEPGSGANLVMLVVRSAWGDVSVTFRSLLHLPRTGSWCC